MGSQASADARVHVIGATLASGGSVAQLVLAKATRDALFLSSFDVRLLPRVVALGALASLLAAVVSSRATALWSPSRVLPAALALNGTLYVAQWFLATRLPAAAAVALYVQVALFGSTLIASLWSLVNESFDPHSAKRHIGRIAMGGTLGGALGGLAGWKLGGALGAPALLSLLALLNFGCIPAALAAARRGTRYPAPAPPKKRSRAIGSMFRDLPYLWQLAALVALTAITSALADYVMSARVAAAVPKGPALVAFFAVFHMSVGLASFVLQGVATRAALDRLGLAGTIALAPGAVMFAAMFDLVIPGLRSAIALKGSDGLMSSSLYRAAYELAYTPVPRSRKRPAKMLIDVGVDRVGTLFGSGVVMLTLSLAATPEPILATIIVAVAGLSLVAAMRLHRGYVDALARSLKKGAVALRPSDTFDATTRRTLAESSSIDRHEILAYAERQRVGGESVPPLDSTPPDEEAHPDSDGADEVLPAANDTGFGGAPMSMRFALTRSDSIPPPGNDPHADLTSNDPARIKRRLAEPLALQSVPLAIELLGNDDVSRDAVRALRAVGPRITGQLVDALGDRALGVVVRRRIPRVLETHESSRAVEGLLAGLFDAEFDVRHQSAWALQRLTDANAKLELDRRRLLAAVREELERGRRVLAESGAEDARHSAQQSVQHAIVVLSLVFEREPLQLAYRALLSADDNLRGTALEYFENVLPDELRASGLPLLAELAPRGRPKREAGELKAELLRTRSG